MSSPKLVGDVQLEILSIVYNKQGMYGLEIVRSSEILKRATIYVHLSRMEDKKWLRTEAEANPTDPGLPRRRYFITGEGQRVYKAALAAQQTYSNWGAAPA